jgi:Tol biopolymer transport system component
MRPIDMKRIVWISTLLLCGSMLLPDSTLRAQRFHNGSGFYDRSIDRTMDFQPAWSPDGMQIAFTTGRTGNFEIYVMDVYEGRLDNISRHPENDFYAVWAPNGHNIAYFSERDEEEDDKDTPDDDRAEINEMIGWDQRPVSSARNTERPSWMPNGDWFVYHEEDEGNYDIYKKHYRTHKKVRITTAPHAELFPVVRPDGKSIAYIAQLDDTLRLAMMDIDGSHQRVLPLSGANVIDPAWSPDGSHLLLTLVRKARTDLVIYQPETGVLTTIDDRPTYAMNGVWSPKGDRIAYLSNQSGIYQIMMYDVQSGSIEQITDDEYPKQDLAWSPRGKELAYVADVGDNLEIFYLNLKNGYTERLTYNPVN